ncbi:hypothetical protein BGW80DRAFT_1373480 [Lactifluus volemus]|nr:hypothetical protein BGW80DRAFT_1373480 [Lactifluus volemus]
MTSLSASFPLSNCLMWTPVILISLPGRCLLQRLSLAHNHAPVVCFSESPQRVSRIITSFYTDTMFHIDLYLSSVLLNSYRYVL